MGKRKRKRRNSPRRSVRAKAKSAEEAIANALSELGVERAEAEIEIIRVGSRGVLGFGAEDAEVIVSVQVPGPPEMEPAEPDEPDPSAEAAPPAPGPREEAAEQEPVQVQIRTDPSRAVVSRGEVVLCQTPCDLSLPPEPDPVRLTVEHKGYEPTELLLTLSPGAGLVRELNLKRSRSTRRRASEGSTRAAKKPATVRPSTPAEPESSAGAEEAPTQPKRRLRGFRPTR